MADQVFRPPDDPGEFVVGLVAPLARHIDGRSPEVGRRRCLADTDQLLNEIEELRLERSALTQHLVDRIAHLETEVVGHASGSRIHGLNTGGAHELVLGLQHRLMAANPGNPQAPRPGAAVLSWRRR